MDMPNVANETQTAENVWKMAGNDGKNIKMHRVKDQNAKLTCSARNRAVRVFSR